MNTKKKKMDTKKNIYLCMTRFMIALLVIESSQIPRCRRTSIVCLKLYKNPEAFFKDFLSIIHRIIRSPVAQKHPAALSSEEKLCVHLRSQMHVVSR